MSIMGIKSRSNYALSGLLTQEEFDRLFRKKLYSIHTGDCPDDCSHNLTGEDVAEAFDVSIDELEKLPVGEIHIVNDYITVMRDE